MTVLFDGEIELFNGSWTLATRAVDPLPWSFDRPFANQVQGLLDVKAPWSVTAWAGTRRGMVPLRVEVLVSAPDDPSEGDDVVEATFAPAGPEVAVLEGDKAAVARFELLAPSYRVRYGVSALDTGRERQVRGAHDPVADRCWVQLWPAAPASDEVVQVGSRHAAAWHEAVRAAPRVETEAERADAVRRENEYWQAENERQALRSELERWAGRLPGPRVSSAAWALDVLARPDRDLLDVIEVLPDAGCRVVALGVVTDLVERTRLVDVLPGVSTALAQIAAGRPPDRPFRSSAEAWEATGGPPAPAEEPESERRSVPFSYVVVARGSGLLPRTPAPTPVQEAARAVADVGATTSGFEALWMAMQQARDLVDPTTLAAVVRASLPTD